MRTLYKENICLVDSVSRTKCLGVQGKKYLALNIRVSNNPMGKGKKSIIKTLNAYALQFGIASCARYCPRISVHIG